MDEGLIKFWELMEKCDKIILKQAAYPKWQDIKQWKSVLEMTNQCLLIAEELYDKNINMLWKIYKRRLPAVFKISDIDLMTKYNCYIQFNGLYNDSKLDFNKEFVAAYHALNVLTNFTKHYEFMRKYPKLITRNKECVWEMYQKSIQN